MISANKFAEVRKIIDDDPSARWTGWKNIALNLWDAYRELDQEADWLAELLEETGSCCVPRKVKSASSWREAAREAMKND